MFVRFHRGVTSKRGVGTILSFLLVAILAGLWTVSALADTVSSVQNISNDSNQALSPQIAQDPGGNLHAIWDSSEGGSRVVRYAKGTWNGSSYNFGMSSALDNVGGYGYSTPSIAVSPNGTVMAAWSRSGANLVGQTWNASQSQPSGSAVAIEPGIQSSVEADSANRFHIVANGNFEVQYCQFENGSCTFTDQFSANASNRPDIAIDSNNNVHVVWDTNNSVLYRSRPAGGTFGSIETLSSGNFAVIAADRHGNVYIAYSSNFDIQFCQRTFGTPCTNQHTLNAASDLAPSIGVTQDGTVLVVWRDSQNALLWYDTRESGNWGGSRQLASATTNPSVSPQPYSNRLSVVWSGNYQVQHIFLTVPSNSPSPTPTSTSLPVLGSLTINGLPFTNGQVSLSFTNNGGPATTYTITGGGNTITGNLPAPDSSGKYTVVYTLPPSTPSCQAVNLAVTLSGSGGTSSQVNTSITFDNSIQANATAVNPHVAPTTRPIGVSASAVVTNYGDPRFTRERYALIYINPLGTECSGINGYFVGSTSDTVSSPSDPRWKPYVNNTAGIVNLPSTIQDGQTYNFKIFLRDNAGNITASGIPASITYDVTPPTVTGNNPVATTATGSGNDIARLDLSSVQVNETTYQVITGQPYWGVSVLVTNQPTIDVADPQWDTAGVVDSGVVGTTLNWNLYFANSTQPPAVGTTYYVHLRFIDGAGNVGSTVINSGGVTPQAFSSRIIKDLPYVRR